jgi:hypothetical protein
VAPLPTPAANESRTGDHAPVLKEYVLTAGARNLRCRYPPRSSTLAHSAAMGGAPSLTPMALHRNELSAGDCCTRVGAISDAGNVPSFFKC